jgi:hypothetical protein
LVAIEREFLEHFQEAKKNRKLIEKQKQLLKATADEVALLALGLNVHSNLLLPTYKFDSRLKV